MRSYECDFVMSEIIKMGFDKMMDFLSKMKKFTSDGFDRSAFEQYCQKNGYDWAVKDLAEPLNAVNKAPIEPVDAYWVYHGTGKQIEMPKDRPALVSIGPVLEKTRDEKAFSKDDGFERE